MFDRFSARARKSLGLARQTALSFHHDYIGTEHMLLGIVQVGSGVAASALESLGVDRGQIRRQVEERMSPGLAPVTQGQLPFTPRGKRTLEISLEEAEGLGHSYVGTEHLLLGLIREGEGIAAQALAALDVRLESVRAEVVALARGDRPDPR